METKYFFNPRTDELLFVETEGGAQRSFGTLPMLFMQGIPALPSSTGEELKKRKKRKSSPRARYDKEAIAGEIRAGIPTKDIAQRHGVSMTTVLTIGKAAGIATARDKKQAPAEQEAAAEPRPANLEQIREMKQNGKPFIYVFNKMHDFMTGEQIKEAYDAA